jgi:hypothetical protein
LEIVGNKIFSLKFFEEFNKITWSNRISCKTESEKEFLTKTYGLWQFQKLVKEDLSLAIKKYNQQQALQYPHCAICLLFNRSHAINSSSSDSKNQDQKNRIATSENRVLPINSEILVPEICFLRQAKSGLHSTNLNNLLNENIDRLLQCKFCKLTVHQSKSQLIP